jgi:hypothetical protein
MTKVDTLLAAMTLEEKIGQLNMAAAGHAVTGPVLASGVIEGIRAGRIGSLLYVWGAREVPFRRLLVGPLADVPADMLGPWATAGSAAGPVTIHEGLAGVAVGRVHRCAGGGDRRRGHIRRCRRAGDLR